MIDRYSIFTSLDNSFTGWTTPVLVFSQAKSKITEDEVRSMCNRLLEQHQMASSHRSFIVEAFLTRESGEREQIFSKEKKRDG